MGRTIPAVVRVKNNGTADLTGVVEVVNYNKFVPPPPPGTPPGQASSRPPLFIPAAAFGERLSLPAGSEKQVTLWFRLFSPERMLFRFRAGDKVLGSTLVSLNLPAPSGPMPQSVGVLGQVPPALEKVRLVMPDGVPRAPLILPLAARLLPDSGEELDACSTILVSGFDGNTLTAKQKEALAEWLRRGGHLIIGGGVGAQQALAALPEDTHPIKVLGSRTQADWQAAAQWLEVTPESVPATLALLKGKGATPVGPERTPLGLETGFGDGLLTVLAFDPGSEPWRSGALGQALWKKFLINENLDPYAMKFGGPPPSYRLDSLLHHTTNLPMGAFPGWQTIAIFLLLFTFLAGPITFFVLRWRRRPEYTWLAVPLLGFIFAGAAYGYMLKSGGNVIINSVQVAEIKPEGRADGYTAVGFFAPTSPVFEANLNDPGVSVRVLDYGRPPDFRQDNEDREPPYSLIRGSDLSVRYASDSQWQMRSLGFRQDFTQAIAGLKADLKVEGTALTGTIKNGTRLKLDHVTLMLGDNCQVVPEMEPGREVPVKLDIPVPVTANNPQGKVPPPYPPSWRIFLQSGSTTPSQGGTATIKVTTSKAASAPVRGPMPPLPPNYPPQRKLTPDEQRRANLLENWLNASRRYFGPYDEQQNQPLTLVAWSDAPLAEVPTRDMKGRKHYLSMIVQNPTLSLPPGNFKLPPGLVFPEVAENFVRGMSGYNNLMGILEGYLVYAFRPNLPPAAKVEKITVTFPYFPAQAPPGGRPGVSGQPAPNAAPVGEGALEIYNAATGRWEGLAGAESFTLKGDYADEKGEVRLRVNGFKPESDRAYYFLPPAIAYEGVVK